MYNTQFKVKYNDIETELIYKLKNEKKYYSTNQNQNDDNDEKTREYIYNEQDVLDICYKLYNDELLSVFNAEDLEDDKIDNGMKYVYEIMMQNEKFNILFSDFEKIYFQEFISNEENNIENQESIRQLILIILFSQDIFYVTHKCICQQIETNIIEHNLLVNLKQNLCNLLKNNMNIN
jgi:hypothetical protein